MSLEWASSWIGSNSTAEGLPKERDLYAETFDWSDYVPSIHTTNFGYPGDQRGGSTRCSIRSRAVAIPRYIYEIDR